MEDPNDPTPTPPDEIEVTEIIARIEALEKSNSETKKFCTALATRVCDVEENIDAIAEAVNSPFGSL